MEDLYRENILDHYQNPRNYGTLDDPDISYEDDNPLCGDVIRIDIKLDDQNRVSQVGFSG
jgi:nitrogen fixation NifU-like protein